MDKPRPKTGLVKSLAVSTVSLMVMCGLANIGPLEAAAGPVMVEQKAKTASHPTLKRGSKGAAVKQLQKKLNSVGRYRLLVNGNFDAKMTSDVKKYQKRVGLPSTGVVNAATWAKLNARAGYVKPFFYSPESGWVSSPFGPRINAITHRAEFHPGVDLVRPCGTPIHAAQAGTVVKASWDGGYGNYVIISHGKLGTKYHWKTGYAHLSRFKVKKGQKVKPGQIVGLEGTTGMSTGCHLHFNVWRNGKFVNGLPLI